MPEVQYFGTIVSASGSGFVADRDDDAGVVYIGEREARQAGELLIGDRVSFALHPGGAAYDIVLARRARHLAAVQEAAE
jgi:hypothetical protein